MNRRFIGLLVVLVFGFVLACGSDDSQPRIIEDDVGFVDDDPSDDGTGTTDESPSTPTMNFTPCENGMAGDFPCNGYDLLGRIQHNTFSAAAGNDIWGWTDSSTGKEYALIGLDNGTAFVDISDTEKSGIPRKIAYRYFPQYLEGREDLRESCLYRLRGQ